MGADQHEDEMSISRSPFPRRERKRAAVPRRVISFLIPLTSTAARDKILLASGRVAQWQSSGLLSHWL